MAKILGLDLGTNSIGWAIVDEENEEKQILEKGVRIFSEGVKIEKGIESSKASERTKFRSARRIKFRRKLRKYQTLKVLIKNNMCPLSLEELELWKQKKIYPQNEEFINWLRTHEDKNPYFFRAKAVNEKLVNPLQLGRAFYHLAQRRGFLSNRLEEPDDDSIIENYKFEIEHILETSETITELNINLEEYLKDVETDDKKTKSLLSNIKKLHSYLQKAPGLNIEEEKPKFYNILNKKENLGKVKQNISDLIEKIKEENCKTLGELFHKQYQKGEKIRGNYTHRESHYLYEFNLICEVQKVSEDLRKELKKAIFFQRPLRSQKGLIGKCTFEKDKPRCPISHPLYEEYRMYAFINNIKFKTKQSDNFETLTSEMKALIIPLFYRKSKKQFDFKDIANKIAGKRKHAFYKDRKSNPENADILFNFSYNTSVSGNPVCAHLKEIMGENWKNSEFEFSYQYKDEIKKAKANYQDLWHVLFTYESNDKLKEFAKEKLKLDTKLISSFLRTPIKQGYAALSLKAIKKILPFLEKGLLFSHSVFLANIPEVVGSKVWNDEKLKKEISDGITQIIDLHETENKRLFVINSLLKNSIDKNHTFSKEAEPSYKEDIERKLKIEFANNWNKLENTIEIIQNSQNEFIELLKKREFAKIKRIDEKINDFLTGQNENGEIYCNEPSNFNKLFHPSDVDVYKDAKKSEDGKRYLGSPVLDAVKNPVAMKTLHQLRHLINALIKEGKIDEETKIHIELARDLNDANQRKAIETYQRRQKDERENAVKEIKKLYFAECNKEIIPNEDEILKYQLWEEQKHLCLYTGNTISISDFIGADPKYDIEHTITRSQSYDNSRENLTLCENKYNRDTKKNKIPFVCFNYNEILSRISNWQETIESLDKQIEFARKQSKTASTKEQKDRAIQKRHVLTFERDYWKNKFKRFKLEEVPEGFKNSQLNDTRLMTKYSHAFMKTVFPKVYVVKGSATAEFRKIWGIQSEYATKERVNHIHHAIDAVVIACMTKRKYDLLAEYYQDKESQNKNELDKIISELKPWKTFVQDVKSISEDTLIYHVSEDNAIKPAKKKLRKRGKIQYKTDKNGNYILDKEGKKQIIYLQGDSIRGSLHKDTVYGAIRDKNYLTKPDDVEIPIKYVVRKKLSDFEQSDIKNIIDLAIRSKIEELVKNEGISVLKGDVWMNQEKEISIKKVRLYAPSVTKPIHLKIHRDISKHEYKQHIHVTNDTNFLMAIYEGKDKKEKILREFEIVNLLDAGEYSKRSNIIYNSEFPMVPDYKTKSDIDLKVKQFIKAGMSVILYENLPEEIWDLSNIEIRKRLYKIVGLSFMLLQNKYSYGVIILKHANEARPTTDADLKVKDGDFKSDEPYIPMRKFLHTRFNAIIEGVDFKLTESGEIKKIN